MQYAFSVYHMIAPVMIMVLKLKDLREDRDETQQAVAAFLGCRQQTYSRYENGKSQPSLEILAKLADYFHTSVDYIMGLTQEHTPYPRTKKR